MAITPDDVSVDLVEVVAGLAKNLDEMKASQAEEQTKNTGKLEAQAAEIDKQAALIAAQGELIAAQSDALDSSGGERGVVEQCLQRLITAISAGESVDKLESCPTADTPATACPALDTIDNGNIHGHGTSPGSVRIISCDGNFVRKGPEMVVCGAKGTWSQDVTCATTTTATTVTTTRNTATKTTRTKTTQTKTTTTITTATEPAHPTCLSWYNAGAKKTKAYTLTDPDNGRKKISAWCDMEDDALTGIKGGWTLVGITNGKPNTHAMPFEAGAPKNAFLGYYTKDLTGRSFTAQRFDCGTSSQGVKGTMVEEGEFNWVGKGHFFASVSSTKSNAKRMPKLPGNTARAHKDAFWNDRQNCCGRWRASFGIAGFPLVDGRTSDLKEDNRPVTVFACDPQWEAGGDNPPSTTWYPGASGIRFVRYWLR